MNDSEGSETGPVPQRRRWILVAVPVVLVVLAAVGVLVVMSAKDTPSFPSLAEQPDPSLKGTVAYLDWSADACLWTIDASGSNRRKVTCLSGVNAGVLPDLAWSDDATVEVTLVGEWQKRVDLATGAVTEVASADVPDQASDVDRTVSVDGQKVRRVVGDGRTTIVVDDDGDERVILDVKTSNMYGIGEPAWSPDGTYVLTFDEAARLLLTTAGANPTTRVLATEGGGPYAVRP